MNLRVLVWIRTFATFTVLYIFKFDRDDSEGLVVKQFVGVPNHSSAQLVKFRAAATSQLHLELLRHVS
jgi:hypothetical protein